MQEYCIPYSRTLLEYLLKRIVIKIYWILVKAIKEFRKERYEIYIKYC